MDIKREQAAARAAPRHSFLVAWLALPAPAPSPTRPPAWPPTRVHVALHPHLPAADGVERDAGVDLHGAHVRPEQVSGAGLIHDAAAAGAARRVRPERVDGLDGAQLALVGLPLVAVEPLVVIGETGGTPAPVVRALAGGVEVAAADAASAVPAPLSAPAPPSSAAASAGSLALHGHATGTIRRVWGGGGGGARRIIDWYDCLSDVIVACAPLSRRGADSAPERGLTSICELCMFLPKLTNMTYFLFLPFSTSAGHFVHMAIAFPPLWIFTQSVVACLLP